jgi:hypothetical protein
LGNLEIDYNVSNYDIWTESGRTVTEQKEFKDGLIKYYGRGSYFSNKVRCMVTDEWHRRDWVRAEHIWKFKMKGLGLHKFNLEKRDSASPRNGILMLKALEDEFTIKNICFIYDPLHQNFKIKVLKPDIMDTVIVNSKTNKTFGDINDSILHHPMNRYPFRRILSFHARCAHKKARENGWITAEEENSFESYFELSETASVPRIE